MKIGFLSLSLTNPEKYWDKLACKADCWWGVIHREVYDELKRNNHTKIFFHSEKPCIDKNNKFGNPFVPTNPGESQNVVAQKINPDLWIAETSNKLNYVPKKVPWVQIFHSMPLKKLFFYPPVLDYDLILLPGEYHKSELIRRLGVKKNDQRLKVVGWPMIDSFFNGAFDREQIMNNLGLDTSCRTLMYAPTWGCGTAYKTLFARQFGPDLEVFENLCRKVKEMELNFIVKLHCLHVPAESKKMIDIANKYGVLWLTKEISRFQPDPNPFLWITDVLISDLSGIISDFLTLDRPIIYIDPDDSLNAWEGSDMPKSFRAGQVIQTYDELTRAIDDSINCPERFKEQRQNLVSKLFYRPDGKAADRAAEEILQFAANKSYAKR